MRRDGEPEPEAINRTFVILMSESQRGCFHVSDLKEEWEVGKGSVIGEDFRI